MRFRCAQCRALTQVQIPARMTAPMVTACSGCGRKYRFAVDRPRAADDQERYRRGKEFAETNQIDLGSAYSVLEGVMTLEEAHKLGRGATLPRPAQPGPGKTPEAAAKGPVPSPATGPPATAEALRSETVSRSTPTVRTPATKPPAAPRSGLSEQEVAYDTGFAAAVRDGCLTPQQALERGD